MARPKGRKKARRKAGAEPRKLTRMQESFVREYLVDLNATAAARRAGYSGRNADKIGPELLGKTRVAQAVADAMKARAARTEVTQDYVVTRLRENVERAMQATPVIDREGRNTGVYEYEGAVANGALKLLGMHLGMFKEVKRVLGNGPNGEIEHAHAGAVKHDVAADLAPYAAAFGQFAESVLAGIRDGALQPDGRQKPVGAAKAPGPTDGLPAP